MSPIDMCMHLFELRSNNLHIGSLLIFEPPADAPAEFVADAYANALTLTRADHRLMLRAVSGLASAGLPAWEEVDHIDMDRHLTRLALPCPGDETQLFTLVAHLHESPLDSSRPMWHGYLIGGLRDGRFALYTKIHHSIVDGLAGLRLIEGALTHDSSKRDMPLAYAEQHEDTQSEAHRHRRLPNPVHWVRTGVGDVGLAAEVVWKAAAGELHRVIKGVFSDTTVLPMAAPRTIFNTRVSTARAFTAMSWPKDRIRAVAAAADATGNEVMMAMAAGALRTYLLDRDELPAQPLVAFVPVAQRRREDADSSNSIGVALCNLATDSADPNHRLETIRTSMEESKRLVIGMGYGPSILTGIPDLAPNLIHMLPFDPTVAPSFNIVFSTVPGPEETLYWNGAAVTDLIPVSLVCDGVGLNITVCYYADKFQFGYLACPECAPGLDRLPQMTESALRELEAAYVQS